MSTWLDLARGPIFLFALSFMILGLARHVVLTVRQVSGAIRRSGDKDIPYSTVAKATLEWLVPVRKVRYRLLFSLTSILFHVGVILVPLFLAGHIALWAQTLAISWPAIPCQLADVLTITTVVTAAALILQRLTAPATRDLSRAEDFVLPVLIAVPFASGYLLMHPAINPFAFEATLLVHVMSGNLIMILAPITKLSHMVLVPGTQLVSEVAWHWPADSGSKVARALGKEGKAI